MVCILTARELRSVQELVSRLESSGMSGEAETLRTILRLAGERAEVKASIAAEVFHVSPQTIRNWVKAGVVTGRIDSTGHVFVSLEAIKSAFEMEASLPYQSEAAPELTMDEIQAIVDEVRAQRSEERRRTTRAS